MVLKKSHAHFFIQVCTFLKRSAQKRIFDTFAALYRAADGKPFVSLLLHGIQHFRLLTFGEEKWSWILDNIFLDFLLDAGLLRVLAHFGVKKFAFTFFFASYVKSEINLIPVICPNIGYMPNKSLKIDCESFFSFVDCTAICSFSAVFLDCFPFYSMNFCQNSYV